MLDAAQVHSAPASHCAHVSRWSLFTRYQLCALTPGRSGLDEGRLTSCRRVARELVERWSRPIFDQYREHDSEALKEQYNEELAKARQRRQLKEAKAAAALNAGLPLHLILHSDGSCGMFAHAAFMLTASGSVAYGW